MNNIIFMGVGTAFIVTGRMMAGTMETAMIESEAEEEEQAAEAEKLRRLSPAILTK